MVNDLSPLSEKNTPPSTPFILLGGSTPVGQFFMARAKTQGLSMSVISRKKITVPSGFEFLRLDLEHDTSWRAPRGAIVISFLPVWILARFLPKLEGIKALIATSSTSRFSKHESQDALERDVAAKLTQAENNIEVWAAHTNASWTILRPTLIYDGKTDKNVTRIARFISRWHFLPMASPACGLRQPIHTDDVAKAALCAIGKSTAANKAFNIAGGEVLSYRDMATRIFWSLHKKPRFLLLPTSLLQKIFRLAAALRIMREKSFGASMFQRMNEDLIFDIEEGLQILDYAPRPFRPEIYLEGSGVDAVSARSKSS